MHIIQSQHFKKCLLPFLDPDKDERDTEVGSGVTIFNVPVSIRNVCTTVMPQIDFVFLKVTDPDASSEEAQMANEYEKLSQMCSKQNKYAKQYSVAVDQGIK